MMSFAYVLHDQAWELSSSKLDERWIEFSGGILADVRPYPITVIGTMNSTQSVSTNIIVALQSYPNDPRRVYRLVKPDIASGRITIMPKGSRSQLHIAITTQSQVSADSELRDVLGEFIQFLDRTATRVGARKEQLPEGRQMETEFRLKTGVSPTQFINAVEYAKRKLTGDYGCTLIVLPAKSANPEEKRTVQLKASRVGTNPDYPGYPEHLTSSSMECFAPRVILRIPDDGRDIYLPVWRVIIEGLLEDGIVEPEEVQRLNASVPGLDAQIEPDTKPQGVEEPIKPNPGAPLETWFDYFYALQRIGRRYSLKDLSQDAALSYGYVRAEHAKYNVSSG